MGGSSWSSVQRLDLRAFGSSFLVVIQSSNTSERAHHRQPHSRRAWEMLLAMLVMDSAFGIPGVIAAPIYYVPSRRNHPSKSDLRSIRRGRLFRSATAAVEVLRNRFRVSRT